MEATAGELVLVGGVASLFRLLKMSVNDLLLVESAGAAAAAAVLLITLAPNVNEANGLGLEVAAAGSAGFSGAAGDCSLGGA